MLPLRSLTLSSLAMLAFAGNSLLCRQALKHTSIDAASFTSLRLLSGALMLCLLLALRRKNWQLGGRQSGSWFSSLALFAYAAGFSFAYVHLSAASGALLLFGAVQTSMIGYGCWRGEKLRPRQLLGLLLAATGLIVLLLPGLSAPPLGAALLMLAAGVAWGVYSLRGKAVADPGLVSAGNFVRSLPFTLALSLLTLHGARIDAAGAAYALASGALASGLGYALWYAALPTLTATRAASVQLSVPVLAALGGVFFLGEQITLLLALASLAILGGVALVIMAD